MTLGGNKGEKSVFPKMMKFSSSVAAISSKQWLLSLWNHSSDNKLISSPMLLLLLSVFGLQVTAQQSVLGPAWLLLG